MNKKLLTAAIAAGLMAPGLAAADVKIFGAIQAEVGTIDVDIQGAPDGSITTMGRNSGGDSGAIHGGGANALGIKGDEKLGNGLSAYFKINFAFSTFNEAGLAGRDAFVGIKGDGWHTQFGTMNSRYKSSSASYDPLIATGLQSRATGAMSNLHNGYVNDTAEIGFKSGAWSGGFQITVQDSSADTDNVVGWGLNGSNVDSGSWNANIKYAANNWEVGVAHQDVDFDNGVAADGDADATKIHAKYNFGNGLAIMGQYETIDTNTAGIGGVWGGGNFGAGNAGAAIGNGDEYDVWHIAATYALSDATTLIGKYADGEMDDIGGVNGADGDSDHWAVAVTHGLSKRTKIYGGYMANDYDRRAAADSEVDAWGIGMLHKF